MTFQYVDTYIKGSILSDIQQFTAYFRNVIGPVAGRAEYTDEEGIVHPAVGDPEMYYACVRAPFVLDMPNGIEAITLEEGSQVIGVWA